MRTSRLACWPMAGGVVGLVVAWRTIWPQQRPGARSWMVVGGGCSGRFCEAACEGADPSEDPRTKLEEMLQQKCSCSP